MLDTASTASVVMLTENGNGLSSGSGSENAQFALIDACNGSHVFLTLSASAASLKFEYGTEDDQGILLSSIQGEGTLARTAARL